MDWQKAFEVIGRRTERVVSWLGALEAYGMEIGRFRMREIVLPAEVVRSEVGSCGLGPTEGSS